MSLPIVIIGAGLSGLYASTLLNRAGLRTVLVEARPRAGGRILSHVDGQHAHRLDLGPTWFWPGMNPRMQGLVEALGLPHYPQHTQGAMTIEAPDGSVQRRAVTWEQAPPSHRLVGGMQSLTDALLARLGDQTHLMLNTTLLSMKLRPNGVELALQDAGGRWMQLATQVIVTIPPRLMAQDIALTPAWPSETLADMTATPTWMAGQAKFVAAYARPFWREQGQSGSAVSHRGPLSEVHDASDATGTNAALFGFVGATPDYRRGIGVDELRRLSVLQLTRLFGEAAATPLWSQVQDWAWEPQTAAKQDQRPLAYHPAYRDPEVPEAWQQSVWLAGTERSALFGGYLEGALEAAEAAVEGVLQNLSSTFSPRPQQPLASE